MFFVKFYSNVVGYQDMETYHYSTTINTCICVLSTSITKYLRFQELKKQVHVYITLKIHILLSIRLYNKYIYVWIYLIKIQNRSLENGPVMNESSLIMGLPKTNIYDVFTCNGIECIFRDIMTFLMCFCSI